MVFGRQTCEDRSYVAVDLTGDVSNVTNTLSGLDGLFFVISAYLPPKHHVFLRGFAVSPPVQEIFDVRVVYVDVRQ